MYVNDQLLIEDYLSDEAAKKTYEVGKINCVELGENEYFVMGDNRGASLDSRTFGAIASDDIFYKQSETPTLRFCHSLVISAMIFGVTCVTYSGVEAEMVKLINRIFPLRNADDERADSVDDMHSEGAELDREDE